MVTVIRANRRSAVLTPSSLACLSHMPTINLTSGCTHGCFYCYARVRRAAEEHAIDLFICACKNPDLAHGTCNIGGTWPERSRHDAQPGLFDKEG